MRTATARNPMIAIRIVANQNAHAFGPSSTVARMKMKTKSRSLVVAMAKIVGIFSVHHRFS